MPSRHDARSVLSRLRKLRARDATYASGRILGSMGTAPHPVAREAHELFQCANLGDPGHVPGSAEVESQYARILLRLAGAPRENLTRTAYNVTAFSPRAQEIHDVVVAAFPRASIAWATDLKRQVIVDSWPEDVDDEAARRDWGFAPVHDFRSAFDEYLIPAVRERYR